jgi:hypothetical protein
MPLVMIPPQVAFTVSVGDSEVSVYHVYKNDNFKNCPTGASTLMVRASMSCFRTPWTVGWSASTTIN